MTEIFEKASRMKLRFATARGLLTVENLWDLDLVNKSGVDLNTVAKGINAQLKDVEENFVGDVVKTIDLEAALAMEIVKHIISVKKDELALAQSASARRQELQKLYGLLEKKQDQEADALTTEELQARIAALK